MGAPLMHRYTVPDQTEKKASLTDRIPIAKFYFSSGKKQDGANRTKATHHPCSAEKSSAQFPGMQKRATTLPPKAAIESPLR
jgi:hypothetical protein